jgi:tetratricopeptide (TPR) repeat protein
MISFEGFVKILDFGVSRARFTSSARTRRLRGKPRYMAPEQTRGEDPTPAADVFSLGILCWELLTGSPLFDGGDIAEILAKVRRAEVPPVRERNPEVPQALSDALMRALAVAPEQRGTAAELTEALLGPARSLSDLPSSRAVQEWLASVFPERIGEQVPLALKIGNDPTALAEIAQERDENTPELGRHPHPTEAVHGDGLPASPESGARQELDATAAGMSLVFEDAAADADQPSHGAAEQTDLDASTAPEDSWQNSLDEETTSRGDQLWDPGALLEKRRVVASAVLLAGGSLETRRQLSRTLAELAYKRGAVVHRLTDSELLALFGLQLAGEDDVAMALHFAVDASELGRDAALANEADADLTVRIGTRAGIMTRRQGSGIRLRREAIEEARALAEQAEPQHPVLTGHYGRTAETHFSFQELSTGRRGRRQRMRVVELLGRRHFAERVRELEHGGGSTVGREAELAALEELLARSQRQKARITAALIGEAGMGKSRLVAELWARHQNRPEAPRLIAAAAGPTSHDIPFSLVVDLLQSALGLPLERGDAARLSLIRTLRRHLQENGWPEAERNECADAFALAAELRDTAGLGHTSASADLRQRVANGLRRLRETLTQNGSDCLWVLDNLTDADASSLEVLRATLAVAIPPGAELVLLCTRPPPPTGPLAEMIVQAEKVELSELLPDDRRQLIRDRLGARVNDAAIAAVERRAGGHPLFIEEVARAIQDGGGGEVPASARDVVVARVQRLPENARVVLQYGAVLGSPFRAGIVEELSGPGAPEELAALCADGLLMEHPGGAAGDELAFRHGLIRDVVYESLSSSTRQHAHARVGRLFALRSASGRAEPPATVARHLELGGERAAAATFWLRAGKVALAAFDAASARDAFGRSLALDSERNDDDAGARQRRRAALLGREQAHRWLGNHEGQARDLEELARRSVGEPGLYAEVKNRTAERYLRLGRYPDARRATEEAERAANKVSDGRRLGEAMRLRAEICERSSDFAGGLALVERALAIFRAEECAAEEARALVGLGRIHLTRSAYQEARRAYETLTERMEESGDLWLTRLVGNHLAVMYLCLGEFETAMRWVRRTLDICEYHGDNARSGDNLSVAGTILDAVGQPAEARTYFARALVLCRETGSRWSRADCLVYAGSNHALLGDHRKALAALEEALAEARELGAHYIEANAAIALADLFLRRGHSRDLDAAAEVAAQSVVTARTAGLTGAEIQALSRQAQAWLHSGDTAGALALSTRAVELLEAQQYIEGSEEEVHFTQFRVLEASGEPAAAQVYLGKAAAGVKRKLSAIERPDWRTSFEALELHTAIRARAG